MTSEIKSGVSIEAYFLYGHSYRRALGALTQKVSQKARCLDCFKNFSVL